MRILTSRAEAGADHRGRAGCQIPGQHRTEGEAVKRGLWWVLLLAAAQVAASGQSVGSIAWGGNSVGGTTAGSGFTSLSAWRVETRLHHIGASPSGSTQQVWYLTNKFSLYLDADGQHIRLQNSLTTQSGTFCFIDNTGVTDVSVRLQYSSAGFTLQGWNMTTGAALPSTTASCGSTPGAVDVSGSFSLAGAPWNAQNYAGDMAFFRFYGSATSSTSAPPTMAVGGDSPPLPVATPSAQPGSPPTWKTAARSRTHKLSPLTSRPERPSCTTAPATKLPLMKSNASRSDGAR